MRLAQDFNDARLPSRDAPLTAIVSPKDGSTVQINRGEVDAPIDIDISGSEQQTISRVTVDAYDSNGRATGTDYKEIALFRFRGNRFGPGSWTFRIATEYARSPPSLRLIRVLVRPYKSGKPDGTPLRTMPP